MYFKYGSYQHDANEVNLTAVNKRTHFSPRGKATHKTIQMVLEGVVCGASQSVIEGKIDDIYDAYRYNGKDAGLYMDSGDKTSHFIESSYTLGGTQVVNVDFPTGAPGEFATGRTYRIVLQADIPAVEDQVLWYSETITAIGAPGNRWAIIPNRKRPADTQILMEFNYQRIIQSGEAIGFDAWHWVNPPMFPMYEEVDKRVLTHSTPKNVYRNDWSHYPNSWTYSFLIPAPIVNPIRPAVH